MKFMIQNISATIPSQMKNSTIQPPLSRVLIGEILNITSHLKPSFDFETLSENVLGVILISK